MVYPEYPHSDSRQTGVSFLSNGVIPEVRFPDGSRPAAFFMTDYAIYPAIPANFPPALRTGVIVRAGQSIQEGS